MQLCPNCDGTPLSSNGAASSVNIQPRSIRVYKALLRFAQQIGIHPHRVSIDVRRLADFMAYGPVGDRDASRAARDVQAAIKDGILAYVKKGYTGTASTYCLRGANETMEQALADGKHRFRKRGRARDGVLEDDDLSAYEK